MRRGNLFWGVVLVVLGMLFFLQNSGLISDVFGWFWPLFLIFLGGWVLMARSWPQPQGIQEDFSVGLQGAAQLSLKLEHGVGAMQLRGGAPVGVAITGTKASGVEVKDQLNGDQLKVQIEAGLSMVPFVGPDGGVWRFWVTDQIPLTLNVEAGVTDLDFDLNDLKVSFMKVEMGASSLKIRLPMNAVYTRLEIESGAATLDLSVPQGVAVRLELHQNATSFEIDQSRFPMQREHLYQSVDYETAANKVEIKLSGGANSVKVW